MSDEHEQTVVLPQGLYLVGTVIYCYACRRAWRAPAQWPLNDDNMAYLTEHAITHRWRHKQHPPQVGQQPVGIDEEE